MNSSPQMSWSSPDSTLSSSSPLSPPPPPPKELPNERNVRLINSRKKLIETGYYLGDPSNRVHQAVIWKRVGRSNQLFTNNVSDVYDPGSSQETIPTQPSTISTSYAPGGLAVLYAVVTISYSDCFLAPCGYWKGWTEYTKSFEDVKLSFRGVHPSVNSVFHDDFATCVNNARCLMDRVATTNVRGFLMPPEDMTAEGLKFRHILFDINDPMDESSDSELDERFSLSNWPTIHPEAEEAKQRILATQSHRLVPVPAYDLRGDLIPPQDYRRILPGSIARIGFTLKHWSIRGKGDTFVADVESLVVLVEPPSVRTPRRQTRKKDPGLNVLESPTKKVKRL